MILEKIANYTTSVMGFNDNDVLIGRDNITIEDFERNIIVVDFLAKPTAVTQDRKYDYTEEKESFNTLFNASFSLEFYGSNAYQNVNNFINLSNSQRSKDYQKINELTVFKPKGYNDLKQLVGKKYFERYEVEILVQYNESLTIDTYRIESIPVSQIDDTGNSDEYLVE